MWGHRSQSDNKTGSAFQVAVSWWDVLAQLTENFAAQRTSHCAWFWIHQKKRSKENPKSMISLGKRTQEHCAISQLSLLIAAVRCSSSESVCKICMAPSNIWTRFQATLIRLLEEQFTLEFKFSRLRDELMNDQIRAGWIPLGINASGH